jgi:hypothetical protein
MVVDRTLAIRIMENQNLLELSLGQRFEMERMSRTIDETTDPAVLQHMAKMLLQAWQGQLAATRWAIRQQTNPVGMGSEWK